MTLFPLTEPVSCLDALKPVGLIAIIVTFGPDIALVEQQVVSLGGVHTVLIIDNASSAGNVVDLRRLAARYSYVRLIENDINVGLAAAINVGMTYATRELPERTAYLWLDQDSEFDEWAPGLLLAALNQVQQSTGRWCCVGPMMRDVSTGMPHGFHYVKNGWRWSRASPAITDETPFAVLNLNGGGTVAPAALINAIGGLDESLFIDHVDTEWSFRVLARGGRLFGIPSVEFSHRMGERGRRIWLLGWRVWPQRSALRHYYLYRNAIKLFKRSYVPFVWKCWAVIKLILTLVVTICYGPARFSQLRMMSRGIWHGVVTDTGTVRK